MNMKMKKFKKLSFSDKCIVISGYVGVILFVLAIIIPLIYIVVASFMDPNTLNNQGITFDFSKWSIEGYTRVFKDDMLLRGFLNSVFYSTAYAVISVGATLLAAYPLSRPDFVGKNLLLLYILLLCFLAEG